VSFAFRVNRVAEVAGVTIIEGTVLDGTVRHGDVVVVPSTDLRVEIRTLAFVHSDRPTNDTMLTIAPPDFPLEQLLGCVLVG
jgi:hypothetical protein